LLFVIFVKNRKFNNFNCWTKDESKLWVFILKQLEEKTLFLFENSKANQIMTKQGFDP
jgi:hypothetical protein